MNETTTMHITAVAPLLTQLERERQERIEAAHVAALGRTGRSATPLALCAAHHEREASRYHALRAEACAADDAAQARTCAEAEQMHATFAVACREADNS